MAAATSPTANRSAHQRRAMVWTIIAACLAAGAMCLGTLATRDLARTSNESAEILAVEPREYNFRTLTQKDRPVAEFTLRNASGFPVRILQVTPHCSCSVPSLARSILEPGESATLTVSWNLENQRGNTASTVLLTAFSEHMDQLETHKLRLHATVIPRFYLDPDRIVLREKDEGTILVRVIPGCVSRVRLLSATVDHPGLATEVLDADRFVVYYDPSVRPSGIGHAEVTIHCHAEIPASAVLPVEFM